MQSNVINTSYKVYYAQQFVNEVERVLNENTRGLRGSSERVMQVGLWIRNLLRFIQDIGNLNSQYTLHGDCLGYDTTAFDNGIGKFFFTIYYDNVTDEYMIYIIDVSWAFNSNSLYNAMFESKPKERLKQIIIECVREVLESKIR